MRLAYTNGSARCKLGGATNTKTKWKCMFNFVLQRIRRTGLVPAQMQVVVVHCSPCTHMGLWNENGEPVSISTAVRSLLADGSQVLGCCSPPHSLSCCGVSTLLSASQGGRESVRTQPVLPSPSLLLNTPYMLFQRKKMASRSDNYWEI